MQATQTRLLISSVIDYTLLGTDATENDVMGLCDAARHYGFAAVCVNPWYVRMAAERLAGSQVRVATVVGFPLGATTELVKAVEAAQAVAVGAQELDMVINVGALRSGHDRLVAQEIEAVVRAAGKALVKVILETSLLTEEEKVQGCRLASEAGAHFVKTSTGFGPGGATIGDVRLLRETVGTKMGVKAAGGIRDLATAKAMIDAGANRIGSSSGPAIAEEELAEMAGR
ncbi:MAG: deoxyribose-phosphate aldolase [Firmicutes bacterium]|nr:deoxyribose-phosphate aldolase [Bacillota bacterium]